MNFRLAEMSIVLAVFCLATYLAYDPNYVRLYQCHLDADEAKLVSNLLTEGGLRCRLEGEYLVQVPLEQRIEALALLASKGFPRSVGTRVSSQSKNSLRVLEAELTEVLRGVSEIRDARVKLAIPERTYFVDDSRVPKARIIVDLGADAELSQKVLRAIVNLVVASVPDLTPPSVVVISSRGIDLTSTLPERRQTTPSRLLQERYRRPRL